MIQLLRKFDKWIETTDSETKRGARVAFAAIVALLSSTALILADIALVVAFPVAGLIVNLLMLITFMNWLLKD